MRADAQRRNHAGEDAGEDRRAEHEQQDGAVDGDLVGARDLIGEQRRAGAQRALGEQQAGDTAGEAEHQ